MLAFSMPLYIISRREHGESWHVSASSGGIVKLKRAETERRGGGEGCEPQLDPYICFFKCKLLYEKVFFFEKKMILLLSVFFSF